MSKAPLKQVRLGFELDCIEIPLDQIHYAIPLPTGIKASVKYHQISSSVKMIGLVEPIVVTLDRGQTGKFLLLDGRMRLEVLRDLGKTTVTCLLSIDDEGYTYNKKVNRLSIIQSHRMIVRAAERGVSVQQLAEVLNVSESAIREKFRLLDGICNEVVTLLADKPATAGMFRVLKQMKPFRQIDVAQTMINLGNFSTKLASAMLQATSPEQLTEAAAAKTLRGTPSEVLQRLERELAAVQADTRLLEENYGPANLQLTIIKTYVGATLLENAAIMRWLAKKQPEYLQQLQRLSDIKELNHP